MAQGAGDTVVSYNRLVPWRTLTLAVVSATPRTTGAKPRIESGNMRSSLLSWTPVYGMLSKRLPGV
ncbi:hypothetical protein D3C73_901590 [compost metagenome]